MNLSNLIFWAVTMITGLLGAFNIDAIQIAVMRTQAKLLYESRTETWGTPNMFGERD